MKTKNEVATEKFLAGYNCAQAVLYAYCGDLNLEEDTALKFACGLGAGLARQGEVCGAVTGGILVLGLKFGRGERDDRSATEQTYAKAEDLMARFEQRHGSCLCRQLLRGCDLKTVEGQRYFKEHDLLHETCVRCVQSVIEALAGLMDTPAAQPGSAGKP